MQTDVFISYTRVDLEVTGAIARALESRNLSIWWDSRLLPGDNVHQVITRALAEARVVVAVLSPNAIASDWVLWELSQALRNGLTIVPVLVHGAQPQDLPASLDSVQALVLPGEYGKASLGEIAATVHAAVDKMAGEPIMQADPSTERKAQDARRRLAIVAEETLRQARRSAVNEASTVTGSATHAERRTVGRASVLDSGEYSVSDGLSDFLDRHGLALVFSSAQSGRLYLLGRCPDGEIVVHQVALRRPMGLRRAGDGLLVATRAHLYRLEDAPEQGQRLGNDVSHCYVRRVEHHTGELDVHDLDVAGNGELLFVNTRYNCLATASHGQRFRPLWLPPFISEVADGDRCHLNGLALADRAPAYVTAASPSNTVDGWRDARAGGGIVVDVRSNEIVCSGLSMPHSPRMHDGRLWLLNSGGGELGYLSSADAGDGSFVAVARCPGYARGLDFHAGYAFVGLSRPRYGDFAEFPLQSRFRDVETQSWCGIQIIEKGTGECVEWLRIDRQVGEIHGVAVLPDVTCPTAIRPSSDVSSEGAEARE